MDPVSHRPNRASQRWINALLAILLVSFALRVPQLSRRPLWWDEGLNAYYIHQTMTGFVQEVRTTHDTDPPAHRLALKVWHDLAGSSPFALRYLSVWSNVVSVALIWTIGRWLTNRRAALLATCLMALAPMQVYYAREAKGYAFAATFSLLATYLWGRKLGYASASTTTTIWSRPGLAYALDVALAVGTHYYQILVIIWQGLWTVSRSAWQMSLHARYKQALASIAGWILAASAGGLMILPWVLLTFDTAFQGALNVSHESGLSFFSHIGQTIQALSAAPPPHNAKSILLSIPLPIILGGLALVGGLAARGQWSKRLFLGTWFGIPLLLAYLLQSQLSFFSPRFLLYLGTPYYLLVAQGLVTLGGYVRHRIPFQNPFKAHAFLTSKISVIFLIVGIASLWINRLAYVYTKPINQKEDFRPAIGRLRALSKAGDALAYNYIWQVGYIKSYYPGNDLTFYRTHYDPDEVAPSLSAIFEQHPRLWLLNYRIASRDQDNLPAAWLEHEAYKLPGKWYGHHHLTLYIAPDFHLPGIGAIKNSATFGEKIELHYPNIDAQCQPSNVLPLPLHWQALDVLEHDYHAFVHLGPPNAPPLVQNDGPPHNGLEPSTTWELGQTVIDRRALLIPSSISPGRYPVVIGLYDQETDQRLSLDAGTVETERRIDKNRLLLGYVTVISDQSALD